MRILSLLCLMLFLPALVFAVDVYPQGNMIGRNLYGLYNFTVFNGTNASFARVCIGGDCQTSWPTTTYTADGIYLYLNVAQFTLNETKFNATVDARLGGAVGYNQNLNTTANVTFNNLSVTANASALNFLGNINASFVQNNPWTGRIDLLNLTIQALLSSNTTTNSRVDLLNTTKLNISDAISTYVNRTKWTTIDDYPAACGAGLAAGTIGDTLTCINPVASSDASWTLHNSYPAACSAGTYATTIGDTLTCATPTGSSDSHTHSANNVTAGNFTVGNYRMTGNLTITGGALNVTILRGNGTTCLYSNSSGIGLFTTCPA